MRDPVELSSHNESASVRAEWEAVQSDKDHIQHIVITGINIPFISLVGLLVKLAIAAVPAAIIVSIIWMVMAAIFVGGMMR